MTSLDLAVQKKLDELAADKSSKQSSKVRLVADRSIPVSSITHKLSSFLRERGTRDLWSLLSPPPTGPQSYGWHTYPSAEWVCKASPLLYEMLEVCPNTKLTSSKVLLSLKSMVESRDLELHPTRVHNQQYMLDRLDFTLRILLNMLRTLKVDKMQRNKVQRLLSCQDWMRVQLVLDRVQLPPEILACSSNDTLDEEEDCDLRVVHVEKNQDEEMALALVPVPDKGSAQSNPSWKLKPLPGIFAKIAVGDDVAPTKTGQGSNTPEGGKPSWMNQVLQKASKYEPKVTSTCKPRTTGKAQVTPGAGKKKTKPVKKKKIAKAKAPAKPSNKPSQEKNKKKEKEALESEPEDHEEKSMTYKPGEMRKHEKAYIDELLSDWDMTRSEAREHWLASLRRAKLLKDLSVSELVKRRFVKPGTTSNPFAAQVEKSLSAENVD